MVDKLNSTYRPVVTKHSRLLSSLRWDMDNFKEQVGSLLQLTAEHGLLGQAVRVALAQNNSYLSPDTSFGITTVGNTQIELTMNTLVSMLQTLESRVQAVSDRMRGTGVVFHRLAFASKPKFGRWLLQQHNPLGDGPAAFVDMVPIWSFASSESGATEWLVDLHCLQSVGFKASPDMLYAHSMTTRYLQLLLARWTPS